MSQMSLRQLINTGYDNFSIQEKIVFRAVIRNNGKDYGSLSDSIHYFNILDDDAVKLFDELLPDFIHLLDEENELIDDLNSFLI